MYRSPTSNFCTLTTVWTVSSVHSRLVCSVRRLGFLVVTGACVTIFVNCAFFKCRFIIIFVPNGVKCQGLKTEAVISIVIIII